MRRVYSRAGGLIAAGLLLLGAVAGPFFPGGEAGGPVPSNQVFSPTGYLALTFDDGPWPETTQALLEGLARRGVKATFFLIGEQLQGQEATVRQMADQGHQLGMHTWSHVSLQNCPASEIQDQLSRTRAALQAIIGPMEPMLRPPYGFVDEALLRQAGAPIICWSVDSLDWKDRNPDHIVQRVMETVTDGDILLLHDIFPTSVTAALTLTDRLLAEGYCFVTVEDLFALRGLEPAAGEVTYKLPPH